MWKTLTILAALLAGGAAYLSYENKQASIQENLLKERAEKNLARTNDWIKEADGVLKKTVDMLADMTEKAETTQEQLVKVQEEEAAAQEELRTIKAQIKAKENELAELQDQIKEIGDIETAASELKALTAAIAEFEASVAAKKQEAQSKSQVVAATSEKIEDFKQLEVWQRTGKMEGLSASVSQFIPEYNLVVINAGNNRGVVSRAKLDVRRGGDKIGELLVDVLQPNRSVCKIESLSPGVTIQAGDQVVVNEASKPGSDDAAAAPAAGGGDAATAPAPAGGGADMAPAPAPDALKDPFGIDNLDPAPSPAPAGGTDAPELEDDPFGLGN